GLRAAHEVAVDDERGGAADARGIGDLRVGLDRGLVGAGVEGRAELGHVETDLLRVLLESLTLEAVGRLLILEEELVHLPEAGIALLLERLDRGLGSERSVGVEGKRLVAIDDLHLVAVRVEDLLHGRLDALAERALVLRELLDDDLRVGAALPGVVRTRRGDFLALRRRRLLAVLDDVRVDVLRRDAALDEVLGLLQLLVDDLLELLEGLSTDQAAA